MNEIIADIPQIDPSSGPEPDISKSAEELMAEYKLERDKSMIELLTSIKMLLEDIRRNTGLRISPS
jgi:hypothetical protein